MDTTLRDRTVCSLRCGPQRDAWASGKERNVSDCQLYSAEGTVLLPVTAWRILLDTENRASMPSLLQKKVQGQCAILTG